MAGFNHEAPEVFASRGFLCYIKCMDNNSAEAKNVEKYITIFEQEPGVTAFFTTKYGAVEGAPGGTVFDNPEMFSVMGLENCFKVWPRQVHGTDIAVIRREEVDRICRETAVKSQAIGAGIPEDNIGISRHCTCCEPELFCSYRREGGTYMRMGAGITLKNTD